MPKSKSPKKRSKSRNRTKPVRSSKTAKRSSKTARTLVGKLKEGAEAIGQKLGSLFSSAPKDIENAIKMDHKDLRNFLDLLKDTEKDMAQRRRAYEGFAALLRSHSSSEEQAVYEAVLKLSGREMHVKVAEGFVEHQVANDLMARLERAKDALTWSAHANVLSETIEHHLLEEERDLLPLIGDATSQAKNSRMLSEFIRLRKKTQTKITDENAGVLDE